MFKSVVFFLQVFLYDVEEAQVARAMENIRAEVVEFEREGILRGSVSAADQGNHMCYTHLIRSLSLTDQHKS